MVNYITIIILSALIVIIPQLGFPNAWQKIMTPCIAVLIIVITIRLMREDGGVAENDTYVEKSPIKLATAPEQTNEKNV
ncbi:MAG: hypothetical protein RI911_451 [Candidatus Parcubacteria bacterium]|jgi:chromate transport protein ChrA